MQFGEPEFDLIEPRGVGRREVELNARVRLEKRFDSLGFVRREVVADDVNFLLERIRPHHLLQKADKFLAGVMRGRLALDLAGLGV